VVLDLLIQGAGQVHTGGGLLSPQPQAQNVQHPRMEGHEDHLQAVRLAYSSLWNHLFFSMSQLFVGFCSYASLYFVIAIDNDDNELIALEIIHRFVETLDKYFGNVCELDVVFNFDKVLHEGSALYVLVHLSLFRSYSCLPSLVCMCVGIGILPPR